MEIFTSKRCTDRKLTISSQERLNAAYRAGFRDIESVLRGNALNSKFIFLD
jgi:hypothetical protein